MNIKNVYSPLVGGEGSGQPMNNSFSIFQEIYKRLETRLKKTNEFIFLTLYNNLLISQYSNKLIITVTVIMGSLFVVLSNSFDVNLQPMLYPILIYFTLRANRYSAYGIGTMLLALCIFQDLKFANVYAESASECGVFNKYFSFNESLLINILTQLFSIIMIIEFCAVIRKIIDDGESDNMFLRDEFIKSNVGHKISSDTRKDNLTE